MKSDDDVLVLAEGITSRSSSLWNRFMLLCMETRGPSVACRNELGFLELPGVHGSRSQVARTLPAFTRSCRVSAVSSSAHNSCAY